MHSSSGLNFHKSSYSSTANECVEVAEGAVTAMRDSTRPEAGHLAFSANEWTALLSALRNEEL